MSNNYTEFSVAVNFTSKQGVRYAKHKLDAMFAQKEVYQKDPDGEPDDAGCTFYAEWEAKSLILWHDEYGRVDHAAEFIQKMMQAGHVAEPVTVQWAETCDRARPDNFGGGAVLVTKDKLYWFVPQYLAEKKWKDIQRRRKRLR
jgi:hypothetical protein